MDSWQLGDIVEAKFGKFPFWPCIITMHPESKTQKKTCGEGNKIQTLFHVKFFGDSKTSWITADNIRKYQAFEPNEGLSQRLLAAHHEASLASEMMPRFRHEFFLYKKEIRRWGFEKITVSSDNEKTNSEKNTNSNVASRST